MRLDQRVAETLGTSRNRAQFFIEHGLVNVAGKVSQKCAMEVAPDTELQIDRDHPQIRYVSRSAEKLASFLDATGISVEGFQCLDVGASTGGFTQVLLERSAAQVVAVDVGTAQLHERLRGNHEGVNDLFRLINLDGIGSKIIMDYLNLAGMNTAHAIETQ